MQQNSWNKAGNSGHRTTNQTFSFQQMCGVSWKYAKNVFAFCWPRESMRLCPSRKHWWVFREDGVDGNCYSLSSHCINAQTFVSVSTELNHNRSPWLLDVWQGCVLSPHVFIVYLKWIYSCYQVAESVTVGSCRSTACFLHMIWCCLRFLSRVVSMLLVGMQLCTSKRE